MPDLTLEELRERCTSARAVIAEMTIAGIFVFSDGGLDASTVVCSVDPSSGSPLFTDGPFVETKEQPRRFRGRRCARRRPGTVLGWLNIAEIELSALTRQYLGRRRYATARYRSGLPLALWWIA